MLTERLPVQIDPIRLADTAQAFAGRIALSALPRLVELLADADGEVHVEASFDRDEQGIRYLRLRLRSTVKLVCQRCLEPMEYAVDSTVLLGAVANASQAEQLPERYEPLICGAEPLFLKDIIEEELILSLPIIAKHPEDQCPGAELKAGEDIKTLGVQERKNPFAVLASLKSDGKA